MTPHLILGGTDALADDMNQLVHTANVRFVLCVAAECPHQHLCHKGLSITAKVPLQFVEDGDLKILKIDVYDHVGSQDEQLAAWQIWQQCHEFIDNCLPSSTQITESKDALNIQSLLQPQTVYVHCMRGRSRSATVIISYLMSRYGLPLRLAYGWVLAARPFIGPHHHLKEQLVRYEQYLIDQGHYDKFRADASSLAHCTNLEQLARRMLPESLIAEEMKAYIDAFSRVEVTMPVVTLGQPSLDMEGWISLHIAAQETEKIVRKNRKAAQQQASVIAEEQEELKQKVLAKQKQKGQTSTPKQPKAAAQKRKQDTASKILPCMI